MASKRVADPEDSVKNYQLDITNGKLDALIVSVNGLQKQVSDFQILMQTRPTNAQVDDKINAVRADIEKDIATQGREIRLELGPPVKTSNRLLWALLTSGIGILVSLGLILIGSVGR